MSNKENGCNDRNVVTGDRCCFECNLSLTRSRHLINIEGDVLDCGHDTFECDVNHRTNKVWHSECFKCDICKQLLDREQSCFLYKNKIICREDYAMMRTNLSSCERCRYPLNASDWVRRVGHSFVYHLSCFTCDICSRELKTGERFIIEQLRQTEMQEDTSNENVQIDASKRNQHLLLCKRHLRHSTKSSADLAALDHQATSSLETFELNHKIIAKNNRDQLAQHTDINQGNDETHEQNKYGVSIYQNQVNIGNASINQCPSSSSIKYLAQNDQSIHDPLFALHQMSTSNAMGHGEQVELQDDSDERACSESRSSEWSSLCSGSQTRENHHHLQLNCTPISTSSASNNHHSSSSLTNKSKRVRTTFTEEQLAILQTHFQSDSNPDGQDLERIATITGLSKRVTQVWFQNSRARQKKYMIKRKPGSMLGLASNLSMENNCSNTNETMAHDLPTCSSNTNQHHLDQNQNQQAPTIEYDGDG